MNTNDDFLIKKVGDTYMVIPIFGNNVNAKSVFDMNETGYFIYNLIKEGNSNYDIIKKIMKEYEVDKDTAKNDAEEFINQMYEAGIIDD